MLALGAAACADDESGADPAVDVTRPRTGGSLSFGLLAETAGGFCIPEAQLSAGLTAANAIYETLVVTDRDGVERPYLAESSTVSDDATEFTFTLRDDITFHDGSPLDAEAVALNIDVWRGAPAALAATGRAPALSVAVLADIREVEVVDALTVVVRTARPWPALPDYLASGRFGIAAPAQLRSPECATELIGTGPFELVEWTRNEQLELRRYDGYWRRDAEGHTLPYLDELVFRVIDQSPLDALEAGTVDALVTGVTAARDLAAEGDWTLTEERRGVREVIYALLNHRAPPFDDPAVRRHLSMAVDQEAIAEVVSDGVLDVADQPFDVDVMGHVDGLDQEPYDPEAAQAFFVRRPTSFSFEYVGTTTGDAIATELTRQLDAVGVEVNPVEIDESTLIDVALTGSFDALLWVNHPGVDPDGQYLWWRSGSVLDFGAIADPTLDRLLDEGRSELDPGRRESVYQDVSRRFAELDHNVWLIHQETAYVGRAGVHGLGAFTLPDGSEGAGLQWGASLWGEVWVDDPGTS